MAISTLVPRKFRACTRGDYVVTQGRSLSAFFPCLPSLHPFSTITVAFIHLTIFECHLVLGSGLGAVGTEIKETDLVSSLRALTV